MLKVGASKGVATKIPLQPPRSLILHPPVRLGLKPSHSNTELCYNKSKVSSANSPIPIKPSPFAKRRKLSV